MLSAFLFWFWSALLVCVLRGFSSQQSLWQLVRLHGLWNYPRLSLAQPATHDHTPLALMWQECWANIDAGRDADNNRRELQRMMTFAGLNSHEPPREFDDRVHEAFTQTVMESNSWLAVFQIQDVFGQTARFNTPGSVATTNWSHRLPQTVKQLDAEYDRWWESVQPQLVNEDAVAPNVNPFRELFEKQFGGGATAPAIREPSPKK